MKKLVLGSVLFVAFGFAACGDDDSNNANSANSVNSANAMNNANSTNNANAVNNANSTNNANAVNNANSTNNANAVNNTNPYEDPFIMSLEFRRVETDCPIGSCIFGNDINTATRAIGNLMGRTAVISDDADWTGYEEAAIVNTEFIGYLENGFDCPEPNVNGDMGMGMSDMGMAESGATYEFEARIQDSGLQVKIQDVTNCVLTDDAKTKSVIDVMEALDAKYLP